MSPSPRESGKQGEVDVNFNSHKTGSTLLYNFVSKWQRIWILVLGGTGDSELPSSRTHLVLPVPAPSI